MATIGETKIKLVDFSTRKVRFTGHTHKQDYEMVLVLKGKIGLQKNKGRSYVLTEGDFVLIPPDTFHWMWSQEDPGVYFNAQFRADLESLVEIVEAGPFSFPRQKSFMEVLERRLEKEKAGEAIKDDFFFLWTLGLLGRIGAGRYWSQNQLAASGSGFEKTIRRILADIIESDPQRRLSGEELAQRIGFDRAYLSRRVKQFTGQSLMVLYYGEICDQARVMLESGSSVKETAYAYGFADPYHFSRKFREITGRRPSDIMP